jgi:DNA-binding CsgD family transcriptional regulator
MDRERSGEPAALQFMEAPAGLPASEGRFVDDPRFWDEITRIARAMRGAATSGEQKTYDVAVGGAHLTAAARILDGGGSETAVVVGVSEGDGRLPTREALREQHRLTDREAEVAMLLAGRRTNKEIARVMRVTTHTAWRHTERVLGKLGISSRRDVLDAITDRKVAVPRTRPQPRPEKGL